MFQLVFDFFGNLFTRIIPVEWRNYGKRQRDNDDEMVDCDERRPPLKKLRMNPNLQNQGSKYFPEFFSSMKTKENSSQTIDVIDLDEPAITTISLLDESSSVSDKESFQTKVKKSSPGKNISPRKSWYKPPSHCRSPHKTKFKNVSSRRVSDDVQYVGTYSKNDSISPGLSSSNERRPLFKRIVPSKTFSSRTHHIMNLSMRSPDSFHTSAIYDFQSRKKYGEILGKVLKSPELFSWSPSPRQSMVQTKIIDLTDDEPVSRKSKSKMVSSKSTSETVDLTRSPQKTSPEVFNLDSDTENNTEQTIPHRRIVSPINTLSSKIEHIPCTSSSYLSTLVADIEKLKKEFAQDREMISKELASMSPLRKPFEKALEERLQRHLKITSIDLSEDEEDKEDIKPSLSDEMISAVMNAWDPKKPKGQVLVNNFNYQIKRADLQTLSGLNWLNDEVINFYMELITTRGKEKDFPTVHTFSTFFYPKLEKDGYSSLRRWTRKVDIFSFDLIVVPIHLRVHWCLAVINMKKKAITYFDSMGQANNTCVNSLLKYLSAEHMDKKKESFDTSSWELNCTKDSVPQQMNSCDCGVFACTFAEYTTREAKYNFSQDDMPYFRRKMTYEILDSKLLSWK